MRIQFYDYLLLLILLASSIISASFSSSASSISGKQSGFCSSGGQDLSDSNQMATTLGGLHPSSEAASNSAEIDSLGRFAVDEHNKKENALLEFMRVVKAQEQVVAGTLHHLTLEVLDAGKKKLCEAKVWVKPWMNFKELQEFKHTGEATASDPSNDGAEKGWQSVPVNDPMVQDAANHALKTLQQRSNSLYPYKLQEVVHAKTEVVDEYAKYSMVLKVQRGEKEEKFKFDMHKNSEGGFHVNNMEQDSS